MQKQNNAIDFVVTWVDGNDPEWLAEKRQYMTDEQQWSNAVNRYRDWDLMRYWFRGVEKFAPWVNNVYFITCGHYPEWLNLEHPKLKFVKHSDYIPRECLPTYNSNVIELYLHRIEELSEQFVLFNDDFFLIDCVEERDFFVDGLPCDAARFGMISATDTSDLFSHCLLNNSGIINKHFNKFDVVKVHWRKFYSWKYGADIIRNVLLLPFKHISSFFDAHLMTPHLKSTFSEVWSKEEQLLSQCGMHRFRTKEDVSHWVMKWWRYCKGEFFPRSMNWGKCFEIGHNPRMIEAIKKQKFKAVCLNDCDPNLDFECHQNELAAAFETILPDKCSFEK